MKVTFEQKLSKVSEHLRNRLLSRGNGKGNGLEAKARSLRTAWLEQSVHGGNNKKKNESKQL